MSRSAAAGLVEAVPVEQQVDQGVGQEDEAERQGQAHEELALERAAQAALELERRPARPPREAREHRHRERGRDERERLRQQVRHLEVGHVRRGRPGS
jgi:hypothetical protein